MNKRWKRFLTEAAGSSPKAIYMAGGPGSGKSTVLDKIGAMDGSFGIVNADDFFEPLLKAAGIPLDLDHPEREIRSQQGKLFVQAQNLAKEKIKALAGNRENIIIDGTAGSFPTVRKAKERLEEAGYEVAMIYVDVPLEVSLQRNEERAAMGGRKVKPERLQKSWEAVNKNKEQYKQIFGSNFFYYDGVAKNKEEEINALKNKFKLFAGR